MKRIGIFGGSFNPVHNGHIALAKWLLERKYVDEVWLTLSPQNPLKGTHSGATDEQRCDMLKLACEDIDGLNSCFAEFDMPRPSYTVDTLRELSRRYPNFKFTLIIGADNWLIFDKWRSPNEILKNYGVIVYPRPDYPVQFIETDEVEYAIDAPILNISSSKIRANFKLHKAMLPLKVANYITANSLYGTTIE